MRRRLVLILGLAALLAGCAAKGQGGSPVVVALALEGPPLAVAGEYSGMALGGSMERGAMAGKGVLELGSEGNTFACKAELNALPTNKGRVRGVLVCSGDRRMPLALRNIGPDQGIGIARETSDGDLLVFFYHPAQEEARRRLPEIQQDLADARALRQE